MFLGFFSLLFSSPLSSFPANNLSRKYDRAVPNDLPFPSPGFSNFLVLLPKNRALLPPAPLQFVEAGELCCAVQYRTVQCDCSSTVGRSDDVILIMECQSIAPVQHSIFFLLPLHRHRECRMSGLKKFLSETKGSSCNPIKLSLKRTYRYCASQSFDIQTLYRHPNGLSLFASSTAYSLNPPIRSAITVTNPTLF